MKKRKKWDQRRVNKSKRRPRCEQLENRHLLAAGSLDPVFGNAGIVTTEFFHDEDSFEEATATAVDGDGKIIAVGAGGQVIRYASDGAIDTTFGNQGFASFPAAANGVVIQNDGKIVVAGTTFDGTSNNFAIARYLADGSLDNSFGGNGFLTTNFSPLSVSAKDLALQADGKIVVVGAGRDISLSNYDFVLARYNSDGSLDSTFDGDGKLNTDIGTVDFGESVAIQSDGKIVVAGSTQSGADNNFAVVRYNSNGSLDTTFDSDGVVTTDFGGSSNDEASAAVIQSDGKIVVVGRTQGFGDSDFAIARYNPNGSQDATFDSDGLVVTDFPTLRDDAARDVTLQSDGKIVVAGEAVVSFGTDVALTRYNTDGSLDATFGTSGFVRTSVNNNDGGNAVVLQSDGKPLVAGFTQIDNFGVGTGYDIALYRYTPTGAIDTTFDADGVVTTAIKNSADEGHALTLQSDGKIVVAGHSNNADKDFAVARYHADGTLDATFAGDGTIATPVGPGDDEGASVAVQDDGKIIVGGRSRFGSNWNFSLTRFNADGSLDTTFDADGIVVTDLGSSSDAIVATSIQADGKIVVAGQTSGATADFAVARYLSDGSLDPSFDTDGIAQTDFASSSDSAFDMVLQPDGKIVVAGYGFLGATNDFLIVRYNSDGSLDTTFDSDGKVNTDFGGTNDYGQAIAIQSDGKLLVGGAIESGGAFDFSLARYNSDGSIDASFGSGGTVTLDFNSGTDVIQSLVVADDGKIIATGYVSDGNLFNFGAARFNPDGSLDTTFGSDGKQLTKVGRSESFPAEAAIDGDGKILVAGRAFGGVNSDFALIRYLSETPTDFGDAPSPYPTTSADDGARHLATGPRLGPLRDADGDGQPGDDALGDDNDGTDDEDGVAFGLIQAGANMAAVNIFLENAASGKVDAWVDFNRDGVWETSEQILDSVEVTNAFETLNFNLPSGLVPGDTIARVRLSSTGDLDPTGLADDGEVEDHLVQIVPPPVIEQVEVNPGDPSPQRSRVHSIRLTVDRVVDIDDTTADPFQFTNVTTGDAVVDVASAFIENNRTVVDFTFVEGPSVTKNGNLIDGEYRLTVAASQITHYGIELDGNNDGIAGDDYVFGSGGVDEFFRKYGDQNGNGTVDLEDFANFRRAFGRSNGQSDYLGSLDADEDATITVDDFSAFRRNFGT